MSTLTTSRAVDATLPALRRLHEMQTERELRAYFRLQAETILPVLQGGLLSFDEDGWNRTLAGVIFDRGKDTAADYGRTVFALMGRSARSLLRFDADLMDPWLTEVAGNSAENINDMVFANLVDAVTGDDPDAAERLFTGLVSVRAGLYAVSMTTTFANFGAQDGARAAAARGKTWRVNSGAPRESHAAVNGETVRLDETFSNGLRFPGDPSGGADEVAGCQCSLEFAA